MNHSTKWGIDSLIQWHYRKADEWIILSKDYGVGLHGNGGERRLQGCDNDINDQSEKT